jgi:hypothetical protein
MVVRASRSEATQRRSKQARPDLLREAAGDGWLGIGSRARLRADRLRQLEREDVDRVDDEHLAARPRSDHVIRRAEIGAVRIRSEPDGARDVRRCRSEAPPAPRRRSGRAGRRRAEGHGEPVGSLQRRTALGHARGGRRARPAHLAGEVRHDAAPHGAAAVGREQGKMSRRFTFGPMLPISGTWFPCWSWRSSPSPSSSR